MLFIFCDFIIESLNEAKQYCALGGDRCFKMECSGNLEAGKVEMSCLNSTAMTL